MEVDLCFSNIRTIDKTVGLTEALGQLLLQLGTALFSFALDAVHFSTDIVVANIKIMDCLAMTF